MAENPQFSTTAIPTKVQCTSGSKARKVKKVETMHTNLLATKESQTRRRPIWQAQNRMKKIRETDRIGTTSSSVQSTISIRITRRTIGRMCRSSRLVTSSHIMWSGRDWFWIHREAKAFRIHKFKFSILSQLIVFRIVAKGKMCRVWCWTNSKSITIKRSKWAIQSACEWVLRRIQAKGTAM